MKSTMGPGLAVVGTPCSTRMSYKQMFFFLGRRAIVYALSCVYEPTSRIQHLVEQQGILSTTRVPWYAVIGSCILLPSGIVMGSSQVGLARWACLSIKCVTTRGVVGCYLQLQRWALLLELLPLVLLSLAVPTCNLVAGREREKPFLPTMSIREAVVRISTTTPP